MHQFQYKVYILKYDAIKTKCGVTCIDLTTLRLRSIDVIFKTERKFL
jgi:hypothetical protein